MADHPCRAREAEKTLTPHLLEVANMHRRLRLHRHSGRLPQACPPSKTSLGSRCNHLDQRLRPAAATTMFRECSLNSLVLEA